jgi:hypothetical protein
MLSYGTLIGIAAFIIQAVLGTKWPLIDRLQTMMTYSALTGVGFAILLLLQWNLAYARSRKSKHNTSRAYGLHLAIGPAVFGTMWLHSTHFGYGLSFAASLCFLASLASGAILGAYPRSRDWECARHMVLACHIALSCIGSGLALMHGFTALWF